MPKKILLFIIELFMLILITIGTYGQSNNTTLKSPNGLLIVSFDVLSSNQRSPSVGQIVYRVTVDGKPLIDQSALCLNLQNQSPLGANVKIKNITTTNIDQLYKLPIGKTSSVRDHYNALHIDPLVTRVNQMIDEIGVIDAVDAHLDCLRLVGTLPFSPDQLVDLMVDIGLWMKGMAGRPLGKLWSQPK